MIWLDCQLNDLPSILIDHFLNKLLQTVMNRINEYFSASFGTSNNVIDKQMNRV